MENNKDKVALTDDDLDKVSGGFKLGGDEMHPHDHGGGDSNGNGQGNSGTPEGSGTIEWIVA